MWLFCFLELLLPSRDAGRRLCFSQAGWDLIWNYLHQQSLFTCFPQLFLPTAFISFRAETHKLQQTFRDLTLWLEKNNYKSVSVFFKDWVSSLALSSEDSHSPLQSSMGSYGVGYSGIFSWESFEDQDFFKKTILLRVNHLWIVIKALWTGSQES